ncbi:SMI1/KNR4 family protein [Stenotrophomonas sp. PS02298]|uniref:SMI1/KNR4 family protein n=1 Tax=Stenotrophomonas sp. PS02298 TaxID=2991424 RepID=UPI00249C57E4|nr:SMI1/KNR4 family protein [Stenotrophomonas sp. PS02298]
MKLDWFELTENPIESHQIEGAQSLINVRFPASYRAVLANHHDSYGDADFAIHGSLHRASIGHWLSLSPWETDSIWSYVSTWQEHQLPHNVVPFATDGAGNCICFDYRSSPEPAVVMWYHELSGADGLITVAPTFDIFLELLCAPAET